MTCPFHNEGESESGRSGRDADGDRADSSIDRRAFMKSALVIGGTSALSTATSLYGVPARASAEPDEPISAAARHNRQHAWDAYETLIESHQQTVPPAYHLLLHLDLVSDDEEEEEDEEDEEEDEEDEEDGGRTPTPGERREVAAALREVEANYEWSNDGVLFTIGYSLEYFRRYDEHLPPGIDPEVEPTSKPALISAETLIDAPGVTLDREDPEVDTYDAVLHLASDHIQHLLAVEAALWGEEDDDDDDDDDDDSVSFDHTFEGIFTKPDEYPARRVGFAGHEQLEDEGGEEDEDGVYPSDIPEAADLSMGFNDQYRNSIPRETDATMLEDQKLVKPKPPGVFAQGTIQHVSKLDINLTEDAGDREGGWYDDHDLDERRQQMFSPEHTTGNTGEVGEALGNSNAPGDTPMRDLSHDGQDVAELTDDHANDEGVNRVGHAQKTARARFDLQERITEDGRERLSGGDEVLPADEAENTPGTAGAPYDDDDTLPGHDGQQDAEQVILRRDVDTVDQDRPGNHFVALMRFAPYMVYMRRAMNEVDFTTAQFGLDPDPDGEGFEHEGEVPAERNGIVDYLTTQRRGNYLVPPITLRALPFPRGAEVDITVSKEDDTYVVETSLTSESIDEETVRFGWFYDVNRARGAAPEQTVETDDGTLTFKFPASETGISEAPGKDKDGDTEVRVRLFGKRPETRKPLRGTATVTR